MMGKLKLTQLILPILRQRYLNRHLAEFPGEGAIAFFPGVHEGIRGISIYDDDTELTVSIDDLTHSHFTEYDDTLSDSERAQRIVGSTLAFLDDLFGDRITVWTEPNVAGGWYPRKTPSVGDHAVVVNTSLDFDRAFEFDMPPDVAKFVWSGPLPIDD